MRTVDPRALLAGHGVLTTTRLEAFDARLAAQGGGLPIEERYTDGATIELDYRHAALDHLEVRLLGLSGPMTVVAKLNRGYPYVLQVPLDGTSSYELDGRSFCVGPGQCLVVSPPCKVRRRTEAGWLLALGLDRAFVRSRLALHLGRPAGRRLVFQPLLTTAGEEIRDYCLHLVEALDRGVARRGRALTRVLEAGLVDLLLELQPHSHSGDVVQARSASALGRIEAVERHLQAHLDEPPRLEGLARVAGCGVRLLQETFADYCGMSPVEFVRRARLLHARQRLESGGRKTTVTAVGQEIGYSNPGRFAQHYRERFGESPRQTLERANEWQARGADPVRDQAP